MDDDINYNMNLKIPLQYIYDLKNDFVIQSNNAINQKIKSLEDDNFTTSLEHENSIRYLNEEQRLMFENVMCIPIHFFKLVLLIYGLQNHFET
jgi:hypothetical protein